MKLPLSLLFVSGFSGFILAGCGVDPRWGPPRTGLLEPLKWQYENSGAAVANLPVALSSGTH